MARRVVRCALIALCAGLCGVLMLGVVPAASGTSLTAAWLADSLQPRAGHWTPAGSMEQGRSNPFAIRLRGGRVLVGGWDRSPELYSPRANTWVRTGRLHYRPGAGVVRLVDGRVLAVGGGKTHTACEVYYPRTGQWSVTGSLNVARSNAAVIRLAHGRVMVVGGYNGGWRHKTLSSTEIYSPSTGRWKMSAPMPVARYWYGATRGVTRLPDGDLLVAGGNTGLDFRSLRSVERYDVATKTWEPAGDLRRRTGQPRLFRLPSGRVVAIEEGTRAVDVYRPGRNRWAPGPSLPARRSGIAVAGVNGRPLVVGGLGHEVSSSAYLYRPDPARWVQVASMPGPRWEATAVTLKDGSVLVVGGYRHGVGYEEPPLATAIRYHAGY